MRAHQTTVRVLILLLLAICGTTFEATTTNLCALARERPLRVHLVQAMTRDYAEVIERRRAPRGLSRPSHLE